MDYEAIIGHLCDMILVLILLLPIAYYLGIEHEKREAFKRYEQARLAYTAERMRRLNK